ncbi:LA_2272 family surface repeat-containing protein [Acidobacteriota bacterium]
MFVLFGMGVPVFAQSTQEDDEDRSGRHYVVNFSLYYPISLNKSEYDSVNFNLSLAYGKVGSVRGLDISAGGSAINGDLRGIQLCGLLGVIGDTGRGIQLSGLINVAGDSFFGIQGSGLINVVGNGFKGIQSSGLISVAGQGGFGLQMSGLASVAGETFNGLQTSGIFSVTGEKFKGVQAAGIFSVTGDSCFGLQASGVFNVTGDVLKGLQTAPFNVAAHSEGVQVGVVNVAGNSSGVQIGVVNYTQEENTGVPFGLVNLAENGRIRGTLWGGNTVAATAGVKFTVSRFYSILSLGYGNLEDNIGGSLTYGFHYGIMFPVKNLSFGVDLGYRIRDNKRLFRHTGLDPDQFMLEGRILLDVPLTEGISLLLGAGGSYIFDTNESIRNGELKPIFLAGIEFF